MLASILYLPAVLLAMLLDRMVLKDVSGNPP